MLRHLHDDQRQAEEEENSCAFCPSTVVSKRPTPSVKYKYGLPRLPYDMAEETSKLCTTISTRNDGSRLLCCEKKELCKSSVIIRNADGKSVKKSSRVVRIRPSGLQDTEMYGV